MPKTTLTVGFAHYNDPRASQTLKTLAMYHILEGINFVVVDSSPNTEYGKALKDMCSGLGPKLVKYVALSENLGTTQPRERIFTEATGDAVLVMDCHVNLYPGSLQRLRQWYDDNPDSLDLLSGPLVYNAGVRCETHFADVWRGQMWGVWARDERIKPIEEWLTGYPADAANEPPDISAFEIPGMGLGMFTCRKSAWLGFNPHFRGFGGEEMYIHEKFRRAGHKALCLPFLCWWHDFSRPWGATYRNDLRDRVRNYVLGALENGASLDPIYNHFVSLTETHGQPLAVHLVTEHSIDHKKVNEAAASGPEALDALHRSVKLAEHHWKAIVADPEKPIDHAHHAQAAPRVTVQLTERKDKNSGRPLPPDGVSLDAAFEWGRQVAKRDLDQDFPLLKEWAGKVDHVTEFTKRRESTLALVGGRPKTLVSYQLEADDLQPIIRELVVADGEVVQAMIAVDGKQRRFVETLTEHHGGDSLKVPSIAATDLLYLDTVPSAERLAPELERHAGQVRRAIIIRGTRAFGETAEFTHDKPGLFPAIKAFIADHPEWFVACQSMNQYGMTVLSRSEEDRPQQAIFPWPKGYGPGTEMSKLLEAIGVTSKPGCSCKALARKMDEIGPEGCRKERENLVKAMTENAGKWSWAEAVTAAARAAANGTAFKLNPFDLYGSLLDLAIEKAESTAA